MDTNCKPRIKEARVHRLDKKNPTIYTHFSYTLCGWIPSLGLWKETTEEVTCKTCLASLKAKEPKATAEAIRKKTYQKETKRNGNRTK